jgi:uncharacterized membrane protein YdbT with pleckstrin-like domain
MDKFKKYHFKEIRNDEDILKVIHRHWFDILQQFFIIILMIFVLVGGFLIVPNVYPDLSRSPDMYHFFLFLENTFALFLWIYVFFIWIDYYFDVWVITSKRIVNIEQKGLFMRHLSELKMERIQDVTVEVNGVIPTVLNYGDVFVQTAGETERFAFRKVPTPYAVKDLIMSLQKEQIAEETNELGEMIREKIHDEMV